MGRTFYTRCKEHTEAIRNNNGNSGYESITDTVKAVKTDKKKDNI
jgi:hypothetical protein